MLFRLEHIVRLMLMVIAVSMLSACRHAGQQDFSGDKVTGNVALRISMGATGSASHVAPRHASAQRVSPQGGEHGDGLEAGQHHENDIHTISLYAYKGSINGDASTPVRLVAHLTGLDLTPEQAAIVDGMYEYTLRVDDRFINGYVFSPADKFIVVTNQVSIGASTLGELRDAFVMKPVEKVAAGEAINGCTDFVMSNEKESSYAQGIGSFENPHLIRVQIERITARVDFVTTGSTIDTDHQSLRYEAVDGPKAKKVGDVYVSHVRVMNAMQAPSYVIKRLAGSESDASIYLADEDKPARKIVVEPYSWQKGTADADMLNSWYGASHIRQVQTLGDEWFRDADRVHLVGTDGSHDGFDVGVSTDEWNDTYYVLDYVNENTMLPEHTDGRVTTGVMIRAVYRPSRVVRLAADGTVVDDENYTYGQSFWRYRPFEREFDETKVLYFASEADAAAYMSAHADTPAEITAYEQARCYYPVFLRHDNTRNTPEMDCMSFGIVRNNIYRLKVGFTGPGYPTPDTSVEVDPEGLRPYIYVRKWYKITHPEIEL